MSRSQNELKFGGPKFDLPGFLAGTGTNSET